MVELDELNRLRSKVQALQDKQDVQDLYVKFFRGLDRNDVELMKSVFLADAQINYGNESYTLAQFIDRRANKHLTLFVNWGHLMTNPSIDIEGDVAHVEVYVTGLFMRRGGKSDRDEPSIAGGRFLDRLVRKNGEWRITVREYIPHFATRGYSATLNTLYKKQGEWLNACAAGAWDRRDPSYARPLTTRQSASGAVCASGKQAPPAKSTVPE